MTSQLTPDAAAIAAAREQYAKRHFQRSDPVTTEWADILAAAYAADAGLSTWYIVAQERIAALVAENERLQSCHS